MFSIHTSLPVIDVEQGVPVVVLQHLSVTSLCRYSSEVLDIFRSHLLLNKPSEVVPSTDTSYKAEK